MGQTWKRGQGPWDRDLTVRSPRSPCSAFWPAAELVDLFLNRLGSGVGVLTNSCSCQEGNKLRVKSQAQQRSGYRDSWQNSGRLSSALLTTPPKPPKPPLVSQHRLLRAFPLVLTPTAAANHQLSLAATRLTVIPNRAANVNSRTIWNL